MDFSYLDDWTEEEQIIEEAGEGYRNVWAVAEVVSGQVAPDSLATMGQARALADRIGVYAYGVLVGDGVQSLGQELIAAGADKVWIADHPSLAEYQPEAWTEILAGLVEKYRPEIMLQAATPLGSDLAPRLAQRLGTGLMSHCVALDLDMSERLLLGTVPALGGEVYHTVSCPAARPQMATLEPGYFRSPYPDSYRSGDVQQVEVDPAAGRLSWSRGEVAVELPPMRLARAKRVVAGGRGLGSGAGFAAIQQLAAALGARVAGSRGAYDEGWITEDQIVGVGGSTIAPDLYVACGISGDVYHCFGLRDAGFVVAINTDASAPINKVANLTAVGDAGQIISALLEAMSD